ncbi:MAG: DNA methyltransferase [Thermodesulfobacteriota bacterium]
MKSVSSTQIPLDFGADFKRRLSERHSSVNNKLGEEDRLVHDWYRFVLSFPPHLVRSYLDEFSVDSQSLVLDPFCGTGTTLVECKLNGIPSVGIEANPFPKFASSVKISWEIDPDRMLDLAHRIAERTSELLLAEGIDDERMVSEPDPGRLRRVPPESERLLLKDSISPLPLHKTLVLCEQIEQASGEQGYHHLRLALASALVHRVSNLKFGPEVGVGQIKADAPVISNWLKEVSRFALDLGAVNKKRSAGSTLYLADSREVSSVLQGTSVDAVITSPPYPNEKDYTRTTRLESVLLGFVTSKRDLRRFKKSFVRSNTRGVYKEDTDHLWVAQNKRIATIADKIERRRIELGKTSGFERLYPRVTKLYFGGMARHFEELKRVLKPGARLAYVVGDQASYLRVMIRTGELLAEIAQAMGYELERVDLFRKRFATATGEMLREEVVILKWPGN